MAYIFSIIGQKVWVIRLWNRPFFGHDHFTSSQFIRVKRIFIIREIYVSNEKKDEASKAYYYYLFPVGTEFLKSFYHFSQLSQQSSRADILYCSASAQPGNKTYADSAENNCRGGRNNIWSDYRVIYRKIYA